VGAALHGYTNLKKFMAGKVTAKAAVRKTARDSIGIGLATGIGIAAANIARASVLVAFSMAVVPFLVGLAATGGAKAAWDRGMRNKRTHGPDKENVDKPD
jgi:hypothetical protein